jgi:hypothetical protein
MKTDKQIRIIRRLTVAFIACLVLSGITAFPLASEMDFLSNNIEAFPDFIQNWIREVNDSVQHTDAKILYGTDWLAFAHLIIASFFVGVYINPVKNKFIVQIGMIACFAIFPLAFICGPIRGIPFFHQLIDCCFGIIGLIPLGIIYRKIKQLENKDQSLIIA